MKKRPSLEELSKILGVSKSLISFVINNKAERYGISQETKKKVLDTITELGYQPNSFARSLRMGRSNAITLIVPRISNPFFASIAEQIENRASAVGYRVFIANTGEVKEKEEDLLTSLINTNTTDGIILATCSDDAESFKNIVPKKFPCIFIDRHIQGLENGTVTLDNFEGAKQMTQHLISKGCKRIGLLAISPTHISSIYDRVNGYKEALLVENISFRKGLIREIPFDYQKSFLKQQISALIEEEKIDALFVLNNSLARTCLEILHELKINIPKNVRFASFDDADLFWLMQPSVSVVSQPVEEITNAAFELLMLSMRRRNNEVIEADPERKIVIKPELIFRSSTK